MKKLFETIVDLLKLSQKWLEILESAFEPAKKVRDNLNDWYFGQNGKFARFIVYVLLILSLLNGVGFILRQIDIKGSVELTADTLHNLRKYQIPDSTGNQLESISDQATQARKNAEVFQEIEKIEVFPDTLKKIIKSRFIREGAVVRQLDSIRFIPERVLESLTELKDKEFGSEKAFVEKLRSIVGDKKTEKYKDLILRFASYGFASEVTSVAGIRKIIYVSELIVIILITFNIIFFPNFAPLRNTKSDNLVLQYAYSSSERFLNYWPGLWISWFFLYGVLSLAIFNVLDGDSPTVLAFVNMCNNLSGVVILSLYYEMAEKTEVEGGTYQIKKVWVAVGLLLLSLLLLELILTANTETISNNISYVFSLLSGIIIGVATGLLATKLSSRIINLPLWAVSFLVVYAVIQAVFPIIAQSGQGLQGALSLVIAMIAFYGKVFLFIIIHWARDTNRLIYYMVRARRIYDEEEDAHLRDIFMFTTNKLKEEGTEIKEEITAR